jgi:hypothetical protein
MRSYQSVAGRNFHTRGTKTTAWMTREGVALGLLFANPSDDDFVCQCPGWDKGKGRTTAVDGVGTAVASRTRVRRKRWCKAFSDEPKAEYPGLMTVTAMAMTKDTRKVRARTLYPGVGAQVWATGTEAGGLLMLRVCEESERTIGRRPLIDKAPIEDLSLRSALPVSLLQPE